MKSIVIRCAAGIWFFSLNFISPLFSVEPESSVDWFSGSYNRDVLGKILISRTQWHPFPEVEDREGWNLVPEMWRTFLIQEGEKYLSFKWPELKATLFLEFARDGNRKRYENERSGRRTALSTLVLAECAEGKGRFLDDIVNGIWATCEESYWGVPAHISLQKAGKGLPDTHEPTVDLFAGETASLLSWTAFLLGSELETVSPLILERIHRELDYRILTPCLERTDFWWMGFGARRAVNNWNPWCNSNWLTTVLLMERDEGRRIQAVEKILKSLDRFIVVYGPDGGCDEGPGYWGRAAASLFDCLELLFKATDGKLDVFSQPLIGEMARYIYRVHINDQYFVNFADAAAIVAIEAPLTFRFGEHIQDEMLKSFAKFSADLEGNKGIHLSTSIGRLLPALFNVEAFERQGARAPLLRDVWLPDLQVIAARTRAGSPEGLYVAAKGGHNNESHNHNDVGNFIIYKDGQPVIIDAGVETYTARTFSSERYDIWTMKSSYHNLPAISGIDQKAGIEFAARDLSYQSDASRARFQLDIAGAYPDEAGVLKLERAIELVRGKHVTVTDRYKLKSKPKVLTWSVMTPCSVDEKTAGRVLLETKPDGKGKKTITHILYDPKKLAVQVESVEITDNRLKSVWGDRIYRLLFKALSPGTGDRLSLRFE